MLVELDYATSISRSRVRDACDSVSSVREFGLSVDCVAQSHCENRCVDRLPHRSHPALAQLPGETAAFALLGDALRAEDDLAGSLAAYSRATEIDAGLFLAQFKKGHVGSFQGDIEGASRAYRAAIDSSPTEQKATLAMYSAHRHLFVGDLQGTLDELIRLADLVKAMGTPPAMAEEMQVQILTEHATAALYGDQLEPAAASIARRNALQRAVGEKLGVTPTANGFAASTARSGTVCWPPTAAMPQRPRPTPKPRGNWSRTPPIRGG